jgi:predicted transcriptional regulator
MTTPNMMHNGMRPRIDHTGKLIGMTDKARKRSRFEWCLDLLTVVGLGEKKPTRIMQKTNLCQITTLQTLEFLRKTNYISQENVDGNKRYSLTTNGHDLLEKYKTLQVLRNQIEMGGEI